MDRSSDATLENENNKKRVCAEEAEDLQHNTKRNFPIVCEDGFAAKDDSDEEKWSKFEALVRHFASKGAEKKLLPKLCSLLLPRREHDSGKEVSSEIIGCGSGTPKYVLFFYNEIAPKMYANKEIKCVNGKALKVAICDSANLKDPVSTDKLSSASVEFFLEDGEHKEISKSDKGKPLIFGNDLQLKLQNGIGEVNHLIVTDSSYRSKLKIFYLGVRIIDKKILAEFGVNERAISQGFRVFSDRMQGKEKNHPPNWDDGVCRLEGIGDKYKNILSSLQPHPIITVGDFLVAHDCGRGAIALKQILGMTNADNKWDKIVKHAMECDDPRSTNYVLPFHQANDGNYWNENFGGDEHDEQKQTVNEQNGNQNQNDEFHQDLGSVLIF